MKHSISAFHRDYAAGKEWLRRKERRDDICERVAAFILAACIAVGIGALMIHELQRNSYPAPVLAPVNEGGN